MEMRSWKAERLISTSSTVPSLRSVASPAASVPPSRPPRSSSLSGSGLSVREHAHVEPLQDAEDHRLDLREHLLLAGLRAKDPVECKTAPLFALPVEQADLRVAEPLHNILDLVSAGTLSRRLRANTAAHLKTPKHRQHDYATGQDEHTANAERRYLNPARELLNPGAQPRIPLGGIHIRLPQLAKHGQHVLFFLAIATGAVIPHLPQIGRPSVQLTQHMVDALVQRLLRRPLHRDARRILHGLRLRFVQHGVSVRVLVDHEGGRRVQGRGPPHGLQKDGIQGLRAFSGALELAVCRSLLARFVELCFQISQLQRSRHCMVLVRLL
eukprot:scaffold75_cov217-Pinguiococcus_pyrenoidosus.AAC.8